MVRPSNISRKVKNSIPFGFANANAIKILISCRRVLLVVPLLVVSLNMSAESDHSMDQGTGTTILDFPYQVSISGYPAAVRTVNIGHSKA